MIIHGLFLTNAVITCHNATVLLISSCKCNDTLVKHCKVIYIRDIASWIFIITIQPIWWINFFARQNVTPPFPFILNILTYTLVPWTAERNKMNLTYFFSLSLCLLYMLMSYWNWELLMKKHVLQWMLSPKATQSIPYNAWAVHVYQHSELELDIFTRKHPWPTQLSIMPSTDLHE